MPAFLLGVVILLTHILEGITGFGCTMIAMPFAIWLVGIETGRPVLTIAAFILCLCFAIRDYKYVNWRELATILGYMAIGLPIGICLYQYLPQKILITALAVFTIAVSVRGLYMFFKKNGSQTSAPDSLWRKIYLRVLLIAGGVFHGAFTSGGPLAIIYSANKIQDKTIFRATMCAMWSILNGVLLVQMAVCGDLTRDVWKLSVVTLPFLIAGIILGNIAHKKIKNAYFVPLAYLILLVSCIFMLI